MGRFACWVVARGATVRGLRRLGLEPYGEGEARGWLFAELDYERADELDALVARASEKRAEARAFVYDSDFGYVVAAQDGAVVAQVVVKPEVAREFDFHTRSDPDAFAHWTTVAPTKVSPAEVREVLASDWVFAEEGIAELLERAGLPEPYDPFRRPEGARGRPPSADAIGASSFAAERAGEESAVYLVRRGDAPRLVYAVDPLDVLLTLLPNYLHERRFGEWRLIPEELPRSLGETAAWVLVNAGLE